MRNQTE